MFNDKSAKLGDGKMRTARIGQTIQIADGGFSFGKVIGKDKVGKRKYLKIKSLESDRIWVVLSNYQISIVTQKYAKEYIQKAKYLAAIAYLENLPKGLKCN